MYFLPNFFTAQTLIKGNQDSPLKIYNFAMAISMRPFTLTKPLLIEGVRNKDQKGINITKN